MLSIRPRSSSHPRFASAVLAVPSAAVVAVLLMIGPAASVTNAAKQRAVAHKAASCRSLVGAARKRELARVRRQIAQRGLGLSRHRGPKGANRRALARLQRRLVCLTRRVARRSIAVSALRIGINANTQGWGNDAGMEQDQARQTGVKWLREEMHWDVVEPQRGTWSWERYDRVFTDAAQRDMNVLPLLMDTPAWAGDSVTTIPSDPAAYADFAAHVAARYGPGGQFWRAHPELPAHPAIMLELWNEPYLQNFSAGGADPGKYARLVRAAAAAGRAANPSVGYLLEADTSSTNDFRSYHEWIDAMYMAVPDLGRYFDGVAIHPYGGAPDHYTPNDPGNARWQVRRLEQIRAKFVGHGDGAKHFWVTEIGWSTAAGCSECQSEGEQAAYLSRFFEMVHTDYASFIDAVFVYGWRDNGSDPTNKEDFFGMVRRDRTKKPMWSTLRYIAGVA